MHLKNILSKVDNLRISQNIILFSYTITNNAKIFDEKFKSSKQK